MYPKEVYYFIGVVISIVIGFCWYRRKLYYLSFQLPGPSGYPFVGNGLSFLCKSEDLLDVILKHTTPYSSPMKLWLGPQLLVILKDPKHLQIVMQSQKMSTKAFVYRFLEPFMGKGLFTSSGIVHKNDRKAFQPLFGSKYLEGYINIFQTHAEKLTGYIQPHVDGNSFDILHVLHDAALFTTMDILAANTTTQSLDVKRIPEYIRRFYYIFSQRVISFWIYPDCLFKLTKFFKEQQHMLKFAKDFIEEIKSSRLPEILEKINSIENQEKIVESRIPSVLEMMVEMVADNPNFLNEKEFIDHMLTFGATSQDTQSSPIAFTLMMLGIHQEYQEKVVEELEEVLGNKGQLTLEDLNRLKFMEMCIKEAMRLFPVGPFLLRDTLEDFQLDRWVLPAGCMVVLAVYHVHRDPELWEKPNEYYPDHFSEQFTKTRHPFAYLPFSAGPRRCIAQQYSYANMKIIISTILQHYVVGCPLSFENLSLKTDVSIRPKDGYMITIKRRTH